jgi:hypothetical protein
LVKIASTTGTDFEDSEHLQESDHRTPSAVTVGGVRTDGEDVVANPHVTNAGPHTSVFLGRKELQHLDAEKVKMRADGGFELVRSLDFVFFESDDGGDDDSDDDGKIQQSKSMATTKKWALSKAVKIASTTDTDFEDSKRLQGKDVERLQVLQKESNRRTPSAVVVGGVRTDGGDVVANPHVTNAGPPTSGFLGRKELQHLDAEKVNMRADGGFELVRPLDFVFFESDDDGDDDSDDDGKIQQSKSMAATNFMKGCCRTHTPVKLHRKQFRTSARLKTPPLEVKEWRTNSVRKEGKEGQEEKVRKQRKKRKEANERKESKEVKKRRDEHEKEARKDQKERQDRKDRRMLLKNTKATPPPPGKNVEKEKIVEPFASKAGSSTCTEPFPGGVTNRELKGADAKRAAGTKTDVDLSGVLKKEPSECDDNGSYDCAVCFKSFRHSRCGLVTLCALFMLVSNCTQEVSFLINPRSSHPNSTKRRDPKMHTVLGGSVPCKLCGRASQVACPLHGL